MTSLVATLLFALVAGTLGKSLDPLIIGGHEASIGSHPHQGSLQYKSSSSHTCGCSLISTTWVITAAHCVGSGASSLKVVMGLHDRYDIRVGQPADYMISYITKHSGFNPSSLTNDIAVIKLQSAVALNGYVSTIAMAPQGANFDNVYCKISGWGVTTVGSGNLARRLQEATVKAYTTSFCKEYWGWSIGSGHICVGVMNQKGACNGDSGGPLVCNGYLAGLTSFGTRGCYTNKPSVYTRVSFYRPWIRQMTGL